jgi:hypothetical protein
MLLRALRAMAGGRRGSALIIVLVLVMAMAVYVFVEAAALGTLRKRLALIEQRHHQRYERPPAGKPSASPAAKPPAPAPPARPRSPSP